MTFLCWAVVVLTALPVLITVINLLLFRRPDPASAGYSVSVIVPARNEETAIGACVRDLLSSTWVDLEVIVVDDHSEDCTADIVRALAAEDARVRLHTAPPLPPGWSGKQHACHAGALQARYPTLLFIDCDVRVAPDAIAAMAAFLTTSGVPLVSGFPRERTGSVGEAMLIPLIHVLLLGYLPMWVMRFSRQVGLGAGCGQIMLADASVYRSTGGHALIRGSWHDGLQLPRAYRRCGYGTDIFDATRIAECRMYDGFSATWRGLSKNAHEGMATRGALPIWTALLGTGLVAPFLLLPFVLPGSEATLALAASLLALLVVRIVVALRFRQSLLSVPLLPVGVVLLLVLQWRALLAPSDTRSQVWRGRTQLSP
jgi:cellulose synthase/poly-beta-1,6-N-acetylglucosamine synthase-like glycosyltransferase